MEVQQLGISSLSLDDIANTRAKAPPPLHHKYNRQPATLPRQSSNNMYRMPADLG